MPGFCHIQYKDETKTNHFKTCSAFQCHIQPGQLLMCHQCCHKMAVVRRFNRRRRKRRKSASLKTATGWNFYERGEKKNNTNKLKSVRERLRTHSGCSTEQWRRARRTSDNKSNCTGLARITSSCAAEVCSHVHSCSPCHVCDISEWCHGPQWKGSILIVK